FLKTAEGVASFVFQLAEEELTNGKGLERLKSALSYEASAGALVAGVDGIVIKCHGNSSKRAIFNAICGASQMIDTQLIEKMRSSLLE
ncbi:MAG: Phosphate acyltransferase, partial [Chlamydiia bacterium]|nr:Phosphate acyltransferase [Chlamydiia bacterium]